MSIANGDSVIDGGGIFAGSQIAAAKKPKIMPCTGGP
jgi:hypothetical protein